MLISVIIPNYNRANTVSQTIDSILTQRVNSDIEIIIGDDCSTDNAREVLMEYQKKYPTIIKLIFHEKNIGLAANWATCVKQCRGKYICNCDNDDYWHNPNKLQIQLDFMESHPRSNVLITNHRTHNRNTGDIRECKAYIDRSIPLQQAFFRGHVRFCNATIMYRSDFLLARLPLDDFIHYQFTLQDWNTWVILSAYTDFDIIEDSTATFGIETTSITRPDTYDKLRQRMANELECYKYCCSLFPDNLKFEQRGWDAYVNSLLLSQAYKEDDFQHAKAHSRNMNCIQGNKPNWKVICARNIITYQIYHLIKGLVHKCPLL